MQKLSLGVLLWFIVSSLLFAQDKPNDVNGWGEATWGMTEEEVLQTFPESKKLPDDYFSPPHGGLIIESFEIGRTKYRVLLGLDKNRLLHQVSIGPHPTEGSGSTFKSSPPVMEILEALLIDKYGNPTLSSDETTAGLRTSIRSWVFPSTIIDLHRIAELRFGFLSISLSYRRNDAKGKL